jgi:hypothetical protein
MKKNKEKEERTEKIKKITTVGCPSFDKFSANEQKAAFSTLLVFITEYYKGNEQKAENK